MKIWPLFACLITECIFHATANPLLIGAFNIRSFGRAKMRNKDVVRVLVEIIQRYDIVLIQEIRDRSGKALIKLMAKLKDYDVAISARLGRNRYREQYAFVYKLKTVQPLHSYQYPDRSDSFIREPFTVHFRRASSSEGFQHTFSYVGVHVQPSSAISEINSLPRVYDEVVKRFGKNVLIGGDLNADCRYVCASCWSRVRLKTNTTFKWLIDSLADTTTTRTDCSYDRLIVAGADMKQNSFNATVFRFDVEYNLTNSEALAVSDHYPVEFYLK